MRGSLTASDKAIISIAPQLCFSPVFLLLRPETDRGEQRLSRAWLHIMYTRRPPGDRHSPYPRDRMDSGTIPERKLSSLRPLNPWLATAGTIPSLARDLKCTHYPLRLPRKPALSLRRHRGVGMKGAGKAAAEPFLDHVAATCNQSAEVGVHPEDPAEALRKSCGAFRPRVIQCMRATFHLLSPDQRT